ncbi:MAG: acylphosphatase [Planctomycetota bacterium]
MNQQTRVEVVIHGRVQGVFFRSSTRDKARSVGVKGYVRNLPDGTVEAVFEGNKTDVEKIVSWYHNGPPSARVKSVDVNWTEPTGEFSSISIRY